MNSEQLRNVLAPMLRGEEVTIPHETNTIKVNFNESGVFQIHVQGKGDNSAGVTTTKSLKEAVEILEYYLKD